MAPVSVVDIGRLGDSAHCTDLSIFTPPTPHMNPSTHVDRVPVALWSRILN